MRTVSIRCSFSTRRMRRRYLQQFEKLIDKTTEIGTGIHLIALVSDKPTTQELKELTLAIRTPDGLILVVGCSHPGLDRIVAAEARIEPAQ